MWNRSGRQTKSMPSLALLTVAMLAITASTTVSATMSESRELVQQQISPEIVSHADGFASWNTALVNQDNSVATATVNPTFNMIGLGRTCDDPWYELSGIQLITCLLM